LKIFLNFGQIMAIENLKKHLILPLLVLISLFGYIHTKERASKQKAGAIILSRSQNTNFYPSTFLATYFEPWKK